MNGESPTEKPYVDRERPDPEAGRTADERHGGRPPGGGADRPGQSGGIPPAGPHADPSLTNPDATPGTGALTPPGEHGDADSTSG